MQFSRAQAWTAALEQRCQELVRGVCEQRGRERIAAWQELLKLVAPHVERWAARSRVLHALRLDSEDEVRAVLVRVVERLQRGDHKNLRNFLLARGLGAVVEPETKDEELERCCALASALADEPAAPETDDEEHTPLRAWLKNLTDFAARDHAVARLGRSAPPFTASDVAAGDKRRVSTDAKPLSDADVGSHRPPISDWLTLKRIAAEVAAFAEAHLPERQRQALQLRLDDASYAEIAKQLKLPRSSDAEDLVRAAKERLRVQFRDQRERFGLEANR